MPSSRLTPIADHPWSRESPPRGSFRMWHGLPASFPSSSIRSFNFSPPPLSVRDSANLLYEPLGIWDLIAGGKEKALDLSSSCQINQNALSYTTYTQDGCCTSPSSIGPVPQSYSTRSSIHVRRDTADLSLRTTTSSFHCRPHPSRAHPAGPQCSFSQGRR